MNRKKLEAIIEAPENVKENWSETERYIAEVVAEVQEELSESFGGDVDNVNDQR